MDSADTRSCGAELSGRSKAMASVWSSGSSVTASLTDDLVTLECGHLLSITAVSAAAAVRCPVCGEVCSSCSVLATAKHERLVQIGGEVAPLCELLSDESPLIASHETTAVEAERRLSENGLLVCHSVLSTGRAQQLREEALAALATALALPAEAAAERLSTVREPTRRHDIRLEFTPTLLCALRELFSSTVLGAVIEATLTEHAALCECSCIIAGAGARAGRALRHGGR